MSEAITGIFTRIPEEALYLAIRSGLILGTAASIFYLFFGKLFSLPELIAVTLRTPNSQNSRKTVIIVSGAIFISAIVKILYHQHLSDFYPYDEAVYLKKISTLRLIISGSLVGLGAQYAIEGRQNCGIMGLPSLSLRSVLELVAGVGTAMTAVTQQWHTYIPNTPRVIEIANRSLPKNISFDAYMLVTLLLPFIIFLISSKKTMKGMIETLLHFTVGILLGSFCMIFGVSQVKEAFRLLRYSSQWTGDILVVLGVASLLFGFIYLVVKYGFRKPLFSNELLDRKTNISLRVLVGYAMVGAGLGMGGLLFESFLLTVPSASLRTIVFWGLPCLFWMKAVQVMSLKKPSPVEQKA